jgi:membrane-bound lytic murein transglycosylase A
MIRTLASRSLLVPAILSAACAVSRPIPDYGRPLPEGAPALIKLGLDERKPDLQQTWRSRAEILPALDRSIQWTRLEYAQQFFPMAGITHELALKSLERFRELLVTTTSASELDTRVKQDFDYYKSAGWDGKGGGVLFTGYFTPILDGRIAQEGAYRYPLYALPEDLEKDPDGTIRGQRTAGGLQPYPTRRVIEANGILEGKGLELVWLRDPLDAFIAHVNGSACVRLADGTLYRLGYSGKNGQPYTSLGAELIKDKQLTAEQMSLASIREWARNHPDKVKDYLARNDSYVFFTPIDGPPHGSLNVEVTPERTIATDKRLFPRGALVFVETDKAPGAGMTRIEKLMLDQDTGGAIRTAGRADIYFGIGEPAEDRAGATRTPGQMYYLFLRK